MAVRGRRPVGRCSLRAHCPGATLVGIAGSLLGAFGCRKDRGATLDMSGACECAHTCSHLQYQCVWGT